MSEITAERRREILQSLGSNVCGACGSGKSPRMSHCRNCYYSLPREMRSALYKPFGKGYEEAYEASLEYLSEHPAAPARPAPRNLAREQARRQRRMQRKGAKAE